MVLEVTNVSKNYIIESIEVHNNHRQRKKREIRALKNVSFSLEKGDVLGIIGSNGSGKSTLLKILSKVSQPSAGRVRIEGKTLALLEVGAGFHSELTGRENIFLNGSILGMSRKEIKNNLQRIIDFSGIEEFIDIPVKKYSSGMYVRLAFSIAASIKADILFIDEVLALGDLDFQIKCFNYINNISKNKKKTIVIVSHNMEIIQNLCHKCLWLNKGVVKGYDKTNKIVNDYIELRNKNRNIPVGERIDRQGNGKIKVMKIELLNEAGSPVDYFVSGQDAIFSVHYQVFDEQIKEFEIALPIDSAQLQKRLANNFSKTINKKVKIDQEKGMVKIIIKKLPLNTGRYTYNVWLVNNGEIYDNVMQAGYFNVLYGDYYNTGLLPPPEHGVVLLDFEVL